MMLEKLKRLSPVPIKFVNEMQCPGYTGMFWSDERSLVGHPYIEICNNLENHQKIATLIHEIAHAICYEKNCECVKIYEKNPALTEIHAYEYELKWLLEHKQKKALRDEIKHIESFVEYRSDHYVDAAKHIMETKLWQKCLDYIKDA